MRKTNAIVASTLITTLFLSACGTASKEPTPSVDPKGNEAKTPTVEKLDLKWFIAASNNAKLPEVEKDFVKKAIEAKFNVNLSIEHMQTGPDYTNKMNLLFTSGQVPDLFVSTGVDSNKYIQDGITADLTPYVSPKQMPNYFQYWVTQEELKRYQVENVFKRAPVPFAKSQYQSYYIRKDWLTKLGLSIPQTYDEMLNVMRAFATKDPDGNGKNDTYGYTAAGNGSTVPRDFPQFYNAGLVAAFMLEGDKFVDVGSDIRIGKALDDLKKFLDEKVVDPDWFLNKSGQQTEKAQQGKAGIIYSTGREFAFDNHPSSIQKKTKEITGNANVDWQPFHPWASTGVFSEALPGNPFMFGSKTPDNKIKRSIEILDWLCGPEGYLLTHFGQEGTHYKKTGNTIELIPDAFKRDVTDNGNFLSIYGAFTPIYDFAKLGFVIKDPQETDRDRSILEKLKSYKYIPSIGTNVAVPTGMNLSDFRKQMNQYQTKILFEEKDASNWPKYRQELMSKYGGKPIFEAYAEQIGAAHGKKYVFKTEN